MIERSTGAWIAFAMAGVVTLSCMTAPPANPPAPAGTVNTAPPAPAVNATGGPTVPASPGNAVSPGAPTGRPPLTDSARRVRDSLNTIRNDSLMKEVLASIAGRENMPAESVFKNIKILQGVPAGRLVRIMGNGFSPALGVSCGFCHVVGEYDKDDKQPKNTARVMYAMVNGINRDYLAKLPVREGRQPPVVNCTTCHRGMTRPGGNGPPGAPPPRPGA